MGPVGLEEHQAGTTVKISYGKVGLITSLLRSVHNNDFKILYFHLRWFLEDIQGPTKSV